MTIIITKREDQKRKRERNKMIMAIVVCPEKKNRKVLMRWFILHFFVLSVSI